MYDNWIHKLSESYIDKRLGLNENEIDATPEQSHEETVINEEENLFEQFNNIKNYSNILEYVINTLLEQKIVDEQTLQSIVEVYNPDEFERMIAQRGFDPRSKMTAAKREKAGYVNNPDARASRTKRLAAVAARPSSWDDRTARPKIELHKKLDITAGSGTDPNYTHSLADRARKGGIPPEHAEEILKLHHGRTGLPNAKGPSPEDVEHLKGLATQGRADKASRRKRDRELLNIERTGGKDMHPAIQAAADHIHSVLDKHSSHPKAKTLRSIHRSLGSDAPTAENIVKASEGAIEDHYGLGGHSYVVNDDVGGDHSERSDWEDLENNAKEHVMDSLHDHLKKLGY